MGTDPANPYGLGTWERHLWEAARRPLGDAYGTHAALVNAIKSKAATAARAEAARIEAAGKAEDAASHERWLQWQADQLDADARVTAGLLETAAAVEADREAEREAWQQREDLVKRLTDLGM